MTIPAETERERFQTGPDTYAAYLQTPEGRLRSDLVFANLQEFFSRWKHTQSLNILDLGCGTGAYGVRLARLGFHVTMLDSSRAMLEIAKQAARDAGLSDNIAFQHGDLAQVRSFFPGKSFHAVLCHNVLEYVDDPSAALRAATYVMHQTSSVLSILVRSQAGEVLTAAIQAGDLEAAERNLAVEFGSESLFGGPVRLFTAESLQTLLKRASLEVIGEGGVRVVSDYLPPEICRDTDYQRIFELERKLGRRPEFAAIARYRHLLVRRGSPLAEGQA